MDTGAAEARRPARSRARHLPGYDGRVATTTDSPDCQGQPDQQRRHCRHGWVQSKLDGANFNSSAASEVNNSAMKIVDAPVAFPNGILNSLPKKQLAIAWGACLGVGLGLLLLLGWLDQTAGEPADIEKKLGGVRVLAKIPLMKPGTRP